MINKIKDFMNKGLFHILGSTFINKCVAFITNVALVRILSKNDFGVYTAAFNVFSIVFLFSGFGITSGMLYYCSQKRSEESKARFYRYSLKFGLASEVILSAAMFVYAAVGNVGIEQSRRYITLLGLLPFAAFIFDYYSIVLRTQKENKKYAFLLNLNTVLYAVFAMLGSWLFGITGTLLGRYLAYLVSAVIGHIYCRKYVRVSEARRVPLERTEKKGIIQYSVKAGLTSALNNILYQLDVLIIGLLVADASVLASYKVGVAIPENMNFIPASMMVFLLPFFIEHADENKWFKEKVYKLYFYMGLLSAGICLVLIPFAPLIIHLLWGTEYIDAVPCFRILTVSFFFLSTFRLTSTNILLSMGKSGYTLMVSIVTGLANIVLDVILTTRFGSIGAAYATLLVTVIASALSFPYVIWLVRSRKGEIPNKGTLR